MLKKLFYVTPKTLLLIAGIVWLIAGGNILRIGVLDFIESWRQNPLYLLLAAGVFLLFMGLIFYRLVQKHNTRILQMQAQKVPVYRFFDAKSYLIMVFMITGGLLVRGFQLLPPLAIGILYCGIGSALVGAGVLFMFKYVKALKKYVQTY